MARVVLVVFVMSCFLSIEASIAPKNFKIESLLGLEEQSNLPVLPDTKSECTPGLTYRVDCRTCMCFKRNLMGCNFIGCPSHKDVNRLKAKKTDKRKNDNIWTQPCVPGRFYPGPNCAKCFCNAKKTLKCGPPGACVLSNKPPKKFEIERLLSHEEVSRLPALPDTGSECEPGLYYRIDCNRCLCRERKSLACETRLCPSFEDVNRLKAKELTGQPCREGVLEIDCVDCSCVDGKYDCQAKKSCVPPTTKIKQEGKNPRRKRRCIPGKRYRMKDSDRRCTCSKDRKLSCPDKLLTLNSKKRCTPGLVYKVKCNTCTCTYDLTLDCTENICSDEKP